MVQEGATLCNEWQIEATLLIHSAAQVWAVSVMRVGSDTFGDPIFQKGLQN